MPDCVELYALPCNVNATGSLSRGIVPIHGEARVDHEMETNGRRMGRSGAIWLMKVSAATAVLALIGVYAAPAGRVAAPKEPPAHDRHWLEHG